MCVYIQCCLRYCYIILMISHLDLKQIEITFVGTFMGDIKLQYKRNKVNK